MAALPSNFYMQLSRKPSLVIKYCVKMLIKQTRGYCGHKVVHNKFMFKC